MSIRLAFGTFVAALVTIAATFVATADPVGDARATAPVVFVCRNGVAMSVWSAAYFNRLAAQRGLRERAVARASVPSFQQVPAPMELALALDGFVLDGYRPSVISPKDVRESELVVLIDAELPAAAIETQVETEQWNGFPPMREEYFPSRRELKVRVESLVDRLAAREPARSLVR